MELCGGELWSPMQCTSLGTGHLLWGGEGEGEGYSLLICICGPPQVVFIHNTVP